MSKYKGVMALLLTMVLGLSACGNNTENRTNTETEQSTGSIDGTLSGAATTEQTSNETESVESVAETTVQPERERTELPVLTQIPEEPEVEDNRVIFGQMNIPLQENYKVEVVTMADGMEAVCLSTTVYEYNVPVKTYLRHYQVELKDSQSVKELAVALLELTGMQEINSVHVDEREALFTFTKEGGYGRDAFAFIREDDIYLIEQPVSFGDLAFDWWEHEEDVYAYWQDSGERLNLSSDSNLYACLKIEEEDGKTYYAYWANEEYTIYEAGYLNTPICTIESDSRLLHICGDINFDGYTDLEKSIDDEWYLYDPDSGMFVNAECKDAIGMFSGNVVMYFPKEKTIWTYDRESAEGVIIDRECLWQWEGNVLQAVKDCRLSSGEEGIRFWICEDEEIITDIIVPKEVYEQDPNMFREYYERFYAGYAPEETYYLEHYASPKEEYIPQELLDVIAESMYAGTELETIQPMVNDREMTGNEVGEWASANEEVIADMMDTGYVDWWVFVVADGDNDDIEDVVIEEYGGGTGGFTEFVFYKGTEDGSFKRTSEYGHFMEEFAFIIFEGQNYLCRTKFDYETKEYIGFDLSYYEDGIRVEEAELRLIPGEYTCVLTDYADADYKAYAEEYLNKESSLGFYEKTESFRVFLGDAEKYEEDYICDINNDGVTESYSKGIWQPSNMGTQSHLTFRCEDCPEAVEMVYNSEAEGIPMMMWVSDFEGKNITNILYRTGLYDFNIVGYLMEGDDYVQVYCVEATTEYEVSQERFGVFGSY